MEATTVRPISANKNTSSHVAEFREWYEVEKQKGLVDVKFYPGETQNSTVESFFAEVNELIGAEATDDGEFF